MPYRLLILILALISFALAMTVYAGAAFSAAYPSFQAVRLSASEAPTDISTPATTATSTETNTPAATDTPTGTATSTPTPTDTRTDTPVVHHIYLPLVLRNSPDALPTLTPTPTQITSLFDDFSDPNSGWPETDNADWSAGYLDGEFRVFIKAPNKGGGTIHPRFRCSDCALEVDAYFATTNYGVYGLIFCVTDNEDSFYMFLVWEEGYYAIYKVIGYEMQVLIDFTAFPDINRGQSVNHLGVIRSGTEIRTYINNQHVITLPDDTITGLLRVGLMAGAKDTPEVEVRFDNFRASVLTSGGKNAFPTAGGRALYSSGLDLWNETVTQEME